VPTASADHRGTCTNQRAVSVDGRRVSDDQRRIDADWRGIGADYPSVSADGCYEASGLASLLARQLGLEVGDRCDHPRVR